MSKEPLSDHCSLMKHPERTSRPSDCPDGATYIRTTNEGGAFVLNPITPFPLVVEGGEGDDKVTVIGTPRNPVLINGGKGNDSVTLQDEGAWLAGQSTPEGIIFLAALLITFSTIGLIGWRALTNR